jgi:hypothetical protein
MKSLVDLGSIHFRHLVEDGADKTICGLKAARMFSIKPGKEREHILCPKCLSALDALKSEAEASA